MILTKSLSSISCDFDQSNALSIFFTLYKSKKKGQLIHFLLKHTLNAYLLQSTKEVVNIWMAQPIDSI